MSNQTIEVYSSNSDQTLIQSNEVKIYLMMIISPDKCDFEKSQASRSLPLSSNLFSSDYK